MLAEDAADRSLGPALVWAYRQGADELHLLVGATADTGTLARRAVAFDLPVGVWSVDGRALAAVDPGDLEEMPAATEDDRSWLPVLQTAGLEPVEEWSVVSGDLLGLEVARAVDGALQVGVGKHDRWAHLEQGSTNLESVIDMVRRHRHAGSVHQLAMLARERWLRAVLVARPNLVDADSLQPLPAARPRPSLQDPAPAGATDGSRALVCSVGADLDLVPSAVDIASRAGLDDIVLVVPEGDDYPATRDLAGALRTPAEVRTVGRDWPYLYPG